MFNCADTMKIADFLDEISVSFFGVEFFYAVDKFCHFDTDIIYIKCSTLKLSRRLSSRNVR